MLEEPECSRCGKPTEAESVAQCSSCERLFHPECFAGGCEECATPKFTEKEPMSQEAWDAAMKPLQEGPGQGAAQANAPVLLRLRSLGWGLKTDGVACLSLLSLPFVLLFLLIALLTLLQSQQLASDGVEISGVVTKLWTTSRESVTSYYVDYRYTPPESEALTGSLRIEGESYDALRVNGPIGVTYLPAAPVVHTLTDKGVNHPVLALFILFGVLVFCVSRIRRGVRLGSARAQELAAQLAPGPDPGPERIGRREGSREADRHGLGSGRG